MANKRKLEIDKKDLTMENKKLLEQEVINSTMKQFIEFCEPDKSTFNPDLRQNVSTSNKYVDVKSLYWKNKKSAIKHIERDTVTADIPKREDILKMYEELSKKPEPILWENCPEIKKSENEFKLDYPIEKDIVNLLKNAKMNFIQAPIKLHT